MMKKILLIGLLLSFSVTSLAHTLFVQSAECVSVVLLNSCKNLYLITLKNTDPITNQFHGCSLQDKCSLRTNYFVHYFLMTPGFSKSASGALIFDATGMKLRERSPVFLVSYRCFNPAENEVSYYAVPIDKKEKLQTGLFEKPKLFLLTALFKKGVSGHC